MYHELVKLLNKQGYEFTESGVKHWLTQWYNLQDTNLLHRQSKRKFTRMPVVVKGVGEQLQMDLISLQNFAADNEAPFKMPGKSKPSKRPMKYILCIIDVFSKKAWAYPLPSKEGEVVKAVLTRFLDKYKAEESEVNGGRPYPRKIQSDKGSEFSNAPMLKLFEERGIDYFQTDNPETKASIVERFNRTLMSYINRYYTYEYQKVKMKEEKKKKGVKGTDWRVPRRWVDVLPDIVDNYNNRYHRTINMAPNEVSYQNEVDIIAYMNSKACAKKAQLVGKSKPQKPFKVGDKVLINIYSAKFRKGYTQQWRDEVFVVDRVIYTNNQYMFKLKDLDDEPLRGSFYKHELQRAPRKIFLSGKKWKPTSFGTL